MLKTDAFDNQQGYSLSYLYGLYLTDACIWTKRINASGIKNRCFSMQVIDEDFRDYAADQVDIAFPGVKTNRRIKPNEKGKDYFYLERGLVGSFIERSIDFGRFLPSVVLENRENKKHFIEALMDGDGWVTDLAHAKKGHLYLQIGLSLKTYLIHEIKGLFKDLGIETGKVSHRRLTYGDINHTIHIHAGDFMRSDIEFHCWRKQKKVEAHRLVRNILHVMKNLDKETFTDYKKLLVREILTGNV